MNAIVGDNGIITQAQNANVQNGMAVLEEYLQSKYVENYEAYSGMDSKVVCLRNLYPEYFYSPHDDDSIGNNHYIIYTTTDEDGNSVSYDLYLIKKSGLPDDIKSQIVSGEAEGGGYSNYASLRDVYGVTSDLKVFYCTEGMETALGGSGIQLDKDSPNKVIFDSSSNLSMYNLVSKYIELEGDNVTLGDLNSIKTLTIDSSISNLSDLYNFTNLEELIIENANLTNLNGIQNAPKLYYIYLKGTTIDDYSAMSKIGSKLRYLYVYNIDDSEFEKMCSNLSSAEFSNLQYMAVSGSTEYINSTSTNSSSTKSAKTITTTIPFSYLSQTTKQAVKYLSIQCNNITTLEGLVDYKNIITLRANHNSIETLKGIENMKDTLIYLMCSGNKLGINEDASSKNSSIDALAPLDGFKKIKMLDIRTNKIIWIDYINLPNVTYSTLWIAGNSNFNLTSVSSIAETYYAASNPSIDARYLTYLTTAEILNYANSGLTDSSEQIAYLKNMSATDKAKVKTISLKGNASLTNNTIVASLTGFNNLIALDLTGLTNLTSISFVSGMTKLQQCWLNNTSVVDVSLLNNITSIKGIQLNNPAIDLTKIQNAISRCGVNQSSKSKYYTDTIALSLKNANLTKQLENCTNLTYISFYYCTMPSTLDISSLTALNRIYLSGSSTTFKLPSKVNNIYVTGNIGGIENSTLEITQLGSDSAAGLNYFSRLFDTSLGKNIKVTNVSLTCHGGDLTNNLNLLTNATGINSLSIGSCGGQGGKIIINNISSILEKLTDLKSLTISFCDINTIKGIENISGLTSLNVNQTSLYDLSPLQNLTNLTTLTLTDNCISKLKGIENLNKLTYINLNNNSLIDNYTNSENQQVSNLQILANLHPNNGGQLKEVYLSGNTGIMNYSQISNLSWTGKSGF